MTVPTTMLCRTTLILLSMAASVWTQAQPMEKKMDIPFDKEHLSDGAALKQALAAIKKGDALAMKGGLDHAAAMASYNTALLINPDNAELNLKMGVCLLNGPAPASALAHIRKAAELAPYLPRVHFLLGYALQLNAQWDEAIAEYQRQGQVIRRTPDADRTYNMVDKRISECNYGKSFMAAPTQDRVFDESASINSPGSEYGALLDGNGHMYFTSRRPGTTGGKINRTMNQWFEDIYCSQWEAGGWSVPQPVPEPLNGPRNDATVSIGPDGTGMIIYRDETNGGDLYSCKKDGDGWAAPVALPPTVNSIGQESSAWRTADGKWLYFVSSREGGMGGSDIYRSPWDAIAGSWGEAENLGPTVNTPYDEEGVFLPADGKTLYFASQGHSTMGGYDLFKSTLSGGQWSRPENLGWPINSPGDDQFLVVTADGATGYFNSVRPGGMGEDDIYRVQFASTGNVDQTAMLASAGSGIPMSATEEQLRLVGFIKGLKMMQPVEAVVELMSMEDPAFNAAFKTDPATGAFVAVVPAGKAYSVHVSANGFLLHSEHVDTAGGEVRMDMDLKSIDAGNSEVMRNILFKRDAHQLDPSSTAELERLVLFLKEHPALRIEIGGHTDSDNGPVPNQQLSEARAYVVLNWLVEHGIAPDRLEAKGFGASKPVAPNTGDEGKALNRRTEIKVL